ncbi:DUF4168 domain-containing protein [Salinisphaera sp. T31B1]|uniref:DUF4168 domain-containing protein n=1 Tax=Salinisphaera sp. T31B1 TaxID=727963 RepID=UPI00333F1023
MLSANRIAATALMGATLACAAPVFAQDGQSSYGGSGQTQTPQPATSAANVSDAKLEKFAAAQQDVRSVRADIQQQMKNSQDQESMMANRNKANQKMVEAVQDNDLSVSDYNEIARAAQQNPELAQRIQKMR